jgi:hypothetical protein
MNKEKRDRPEVRFMTGFGSNKRRRKLKATNTIAPFPPSSGQKPLKIAYPPER